MGTSVTDTIGRLWIAALTPALLIGAYESWTGSGWSRVLAVPLGAGAIATASYVLPRRRSRCTDCGVETDSSAGTRFCPACGTAVGR